MSLITPIADEAASTAASFDFDAMLRTKGRALWSWRRVVAIEFGTIQELADAVGLAERHVSGQLHMAYLAPAALKRLTFGRGALWVSLNGLCFTTGED